MNNREQEIENALRQAPRPSAPTGLKKTLISQAELPPADSASPLATSRWGGWLRRWWPALAPAAVSVACAVVITVQRNEIRDLKQTVQTLSEKVTAATNPPAVAPRGGVAPTAPVDAPVDYQQEIQRLKQQAGQLKAEIAQLEKLRTENAQLRTQLTAASVPTELQGAAEELQKAKERAMRIACVNNLKQFGLAVRIWSSDHGDLNPPEILAMKEELGSTKILVCPADTSRSAASDWTTYSAGNCSYEYLAPGGSDTDPERVLSRCPIHNTVGLCDGSVQQLAPTRALVQRDGKLYIAP
jgi:hypothetical protein